MLALSVYDYALTGMCAGVHVYMMWIKGCLQISHLHQWGLFSHGLNLALTSGNHIFQSISQLLLSKPISGNQSTTIGHYRLLHITIVDLVFSSIKKNVYCLYCHTDIVVLLCWRDDCRVQHGELEGGQASATCASLQEECGITWRAWSRRYWFHHLCFFIL